jgi:hypothetical protein
MVKVMFVIRDVFTAKPGKAKALAQVFKKSNEYLKQKQMVGNARVLTDFVASYWTVVTETEVEDLAQYTNMVTGFTSSPEMAEIFKGYMDLVEGGHREIFRVE